VPKSPTPNGWRDATTARSAPLAASELDQALGAVPSPPKITDRTCEERASKRHVGLLPPAFVCAITKCSIIVEGALTKSRSLTVPKSPPDLITGQKPLPPRSVKPDFCSSIKIFS